MMSAADRDIMLTEFTTLVCSDPVLLRAEFDDIIAAEFPHPRTPRRCAVISAGAPSRRTSASARRRARCGSRHVQ